MIDVDSPDLTLGVVGAGAMGQGIVQVALAGGITVKLQDAKAGAAASARDTVFGRLERLVEKERLSAGSLEGMRPRLVLVDDLAAFADCDAVIEAAFEDLEVKRDIFRTLERHVREDCLIASNTSSLPIASIASVCARRDRIAGLHFFNPVPLMRLVEVVRAPHSSEATIAALAALGRRLGRTPVVVKDAPGFLVNLGGRAFTTEGLRLQHERVATPAQIDAVMRDCCRFRMGPFELMDLTGIDVNFPVSMIVYDGYLQDPRLRTTPTHRSLYEAGLFGRKTGAGHFRYGADGGKLQDKGADHLVEAEPADAVVLVEADEALAGLCAAAGLRPLQADDGRSPLLAAPLGEDASTLAARCRLDHRRLVALDLLPDTTKRITVMTAPGADLALRDRVAAALRTSGRAVTAIKDSPGFIAQRLSAMVANLGCEMAQIGLAEPAQIDLAMTLGLNYPQGPLALADAIGAERVLAILERLQAATGDDRYRPSLWLRRRALLGLSCLEPG